MKHTHSPRGGRLMIAGLAGILSSVSAFAADIPTGTLNVDRSLVQVGSRSQLDWKIKYPGPRSTETLTMRVRVLGSSFQKYKNNSGGGNNIDGVDADNPKNGTVDPSGTYDDEKNLGRASNPIPLPVEVMWSLNNSSLTRLFYGTTPDVNPSTIVLSTVVKPTDVVHFGAHGFRDGAWLPFYSTAESTQNVVVLNNGDTVPRVVQQSFIQNILKPYLASNNTVKIGTKDLIILMELGQTNPIYADFNLQDLILLVTFE